MYRRILVAIDGSRAAELALAEAVNLAREQRASLRILHVIDQGLTMPPDVLSANLAEFDENLYVRGKALLDAAEARAREAEVQVEGVLVEEVGQRAGGFIVQQAQEWPADLIICGTHGRRGLARLALGSDAEYVVRRATVPVLLLRSPD
ncbi:MAG TPA: universal stress protein [Steroidobacteraceae bacterium]|nr:universal stress protein [Steroidobacteraceae bacterium]